MNLLEFTITIFTFAFFAGILGAMTGLGGGIILVAVLVLIFKIDMHVAMGASLISVIATSSGAGISFLRENLANIRLAMFLESGSVLGAIVGASLVHLFAVNIIEIIFGLVLLFSTWFSLKKHIEHKEIKPIHPWAKKLHLQGKELTPNGLAKYPVFRVPLGWILMSLSGVLSGLLGIGSGAFKVLTLDLVMGVPYKVATSTSNFMLGMTATASAGIYIANGYINPTVAAPVLLGVLFGARSGARLFVRTKPRVLRIIFSVLVLILALQMIYKGLFSNV